MFRLFRPAADLYPRNSTPKSWSLDHTLLRLGRHDAWTTRDACACTLIFGDTGSGKTSGSGEHIAMAMLKAGFGGLVLCAKADEPERWRRYLREAGREDDLVVFSPESGHRFNFLEHERTRTSRGGGQTENLVELFLTAMSVNIHGGGSHQDPFWERAVRQLLRNSIDALRLADEPLSISALRNVIGAAPLTAEQADNDAWRASSTLMTTLNAAYERCGSERDRGDLAATSAFFLEEFAAVMDSKTRGNIVSTFTTMADGFLRGSLRELFCTDLTIRPEETFDGKVIVLDLPIKQFLQLGAQAQVIWKACWQRAVESIPRGPGSRPVFLWADEAQYFVSPSEPEFLQTAREQRACCVYLTQSIANYHHALGARRSAGVDSLLGVAKTKIFHCNADTQTNEWAEQLVSDRWQVLTSEGLSEMIAGDSGPQRSINFSRQRQSRILGSEFGDLRCGGPPDYLVEAILFESGRRFRGGDGNIIRIAFKQRRMPQG